MSVKAGKPGRDIIPYVSLTPNPYTCPHEEIKQRWYICKKETEEEKHLMNNKEKLLVTAEKNEFVFECLKHICIAPHKQIPFSFSLHTKFAS